MKELVALRTPVDESKAHFKPLILKVTAPFPEPPEVLKVNRTAEDPTLSEPVKVNAF